MAFRLEASPKEELARLERLKLSDPESAANVVANGKLLLDFVAQGDLRALQTCLEHINEGDVLAYYSVRMFRAACASRRLDILRFLIANGFDLQHASMRGVLHETVEGIVDGDHEAAERAQPLIRFLLDDGVDVNWQREGDLFTALHIACRKGLYGISYLLVLYGADVNAIASHDEMPLICAKQASQASDLSQRQKHESSLLIDFLVENHARKTWRRQPANSFSKVNAVAPRGKILRFSSSVNSECTGPGRHDDAPTRGLMIDTPM